MKIGEIAAKSGVNAGYLSEIEAGARRAVPATGRWPLPVWSALAGLVLLVLALAWAAIGSERARGEADRVSKIEVGPGAMARGPER